VQNPDIVRTKPGENGMTAHIGVSGELEYFLLRSRVKDRWLIMTLADYRKTLFEATVDTILEQSRMMPREASQEAQEAELDSESYRLRKAFLSLARERCEAENIPPGSNEAEALFDEAHDTAHSILRAYINYYVPFAERVKLSPQEVGEKMALLVPSYVSDLVAHVKKRGKFGAPPDSLSMAVEDYVKGRLKSPDIDRILALALTQSELVGTIFEWTVRTNPMSGKNWLEENKSLDWHLALWNHSKFIFWLCVIGASIAASPFVFDTYPPNTMVQAGAGFSILLTLIVLPFWANALIRILMKKDNQADSERDANKILKRMQDFYHEFNKGLGGPISLARFKQQVNKLADEGVFWPSGLFVLIDDIEARGVRHF
jgi:hypothetical protein